MKTLAVLLPLALTFGACASAKPQMEGTAGPIRWLASEPRIERRDVDGKDAEVYRTTLSVLWAKDSASSGTITRVETVMYEHGAHPLADAHTGSWRLTAGGPAWEIPLGFYVWCQAVPGHCMTSNTTAPAWKIRLVGRDDRGAPIDVSFDVVMPAGVSPRARMP